MDLGSATSFEDHHLAIVDLRHAVVARVLIAEDDIPIDCRPGQVRHVGPEDAIGKEGRREDETFRSSAIFSPPHRSAAQP
jgi:hypothetical protein